MFAAAFVFAFITVHVTAEIPSYIHVCGRRDPNIQQCILNSVNNLKSKICEGMPELDIPSNEPLLIDKLIFFNTPQIKLNITNTQISGICKFNITNFHADIDNLYYDIELVFDQIRVNTTYDVDLHLLVDIMHKGPLYITTDNAGAKVILDFQVVTKNKKRFTYLANMKLNLDIKTFNAYNLDEEHFDQLYKVIYNVINTNQDEIIRILKPALEKVIINHITSIANKICTHFTYEELFPDRI